MDKKWIKPASLPNKCNLPFSHAVIAGDYLYISGQIPMDLESGEFRLGTFRDEALLTFGNLRKVIEAAGGSWERITKVNIYLSDLAKFAEFNQIYQTLFTAPYPSRTTVGANLVFGFQIEVEAVVYLG